MSATLQRILFYLVLAVVCYTLSFAAGTRLAFGIFMAAGIVGELFFWRAVYFALKGRESENGAG